MRWDPDGGNNLDLEVGGRQRFLKDAGAIVFASKRPEAYRHAIRDSYIRVSHPYASSLVNGLIQSATEAYGAFP